MSHSSNRHIRQRWLIEAELQLLTPTHLSNGDDDPNVDLPLLMDLYDPTRPILTGASLAGALRHQLNDYLDNYEYVINPANGQGIWVQRTTAVGQWEPTDLFGGTRGDEDGEQSALIVYDALGTKSAVIEIRDGVRIDPSSRTAYIDGDGRGHKFDLQLLAAGTTFKIAFELLITTANLEGEQASSQQLRQMLAIALTGLQNGDIRLGGRKQRGYGQCTVKEWHVWHYDLTMPLGLGQWLYHDRPTRVPPHHSGPDIANLLDVNIDHIADQRQTFIIDARFAVDGSILIRSGIENEKAPDMAHLEAYRADKSGTAPVLSGTAIAGVIRHHLQRIVHTISQDGERAEQFVQALFGFMAEPDEDDTKPTLRQTSRVRADETEIVGGRRLVQSRVAIDRFTGGALESALFTEQPIFGGETAIRLSIKPPLVPATAQDDEKKAEEQRWLAEKGALLLVLKDLWTGFVPVGGEVSVGRGRLRGLEAMVQDGDRQWTIRATDGQLDISGDDHTQLETYVAALHTMIGEGA